MVPPPSSYIQLILTPVTLLRGGSCTPYKEIKMVTSPSTLIQILMMEYSQLLRFIHTLQAFLCICHLFSWIWFIHYFYAIFLQPLDYEKQALQSISISVDNDEPYYSCEVKDRPANGLWTITSYPAKKSIRGFNITVEDVNEPPYFPKPVRKVVLEENGAVGVFVDKVVAVDPDTQRKTTLQYVFNLRSP